jgi:hypothetical protein
LRLKCDFLVSSLCFRSNRSACTATERHDLVSLWMGDMQFITFRARLTHFAASMICTASLSMGLTVGLYKFVMNSVDP